MQRRTFLAAAGLTAAQRSISTPARTPHTTFLVVHGAWSAGWAWKKMHPLLSASGHRLFTPTCTGLGERAHLANPAVDLETHIADVLGVIKYEQLRDFVLVGHSYGGMVATAIADRVPELLVRLVYLDAFVPSDGQSLLDLVTPATAQRMRAAAQSGDGWRVPANPIPPDTAAEDVEWIQALRLPQPRKTFESPLHLTHAGTRVPRTYIYCKRTTPEDTFRVFAERAKREHWDYREIDASHSPHVTAPQALSALLDSVVSQA